jgi:mannose-6-phosphate isomerase-like protein (cupin superfamily)
MESRDWAAFEMTDLRNERAGSTRPYLPFLESSTLSTGLYELAAGEPDRQSPHDRDEVYYVIRGRARLQLAADELSVQPGTVIYVRAGVEHRFVDIAEDLSVLVFFAGAVDGR